MIKGVTQVMEMQRVRREKRAVYQKLLEYVRKGRAILTAGKIHPDIPTIHSKELGLAVDTRYWKSVVHRGFGFFEGRTENGRFYFNAGGAMYHHQFGDDSWLSWTPLDFENEKVREDMGYDLQRVEKALEELINSL